MPHLIAKRVERLEDWFDSVTVLAEPQMALEPLNALAAAFSPRLPIVDSWVLNQAPPPRPGRRPLVLMAGDVEGGGLGAEPFKVRVGEANDASDADLHVGADIAPATLEEIVCTALRDGIARPKKLNVLVLYCDAFTHIETIHEHLKSFSLFSRHNVFFLPASDTERTAAFTGFEGEAWPASWDLDLFDVVVWHYVVPAYLKERLSPVLADRLAAYDGLKVLFVQDEYDNTATTTAWMQRVGIDVMFTCVPPDGLEYAYPASQHPGVEFFRTLTGYVPEDRGLEAFILPMAQRSLRLAYRGRALPFRYGTLAREKYVIGIEMKRLAALHGVSADIAVDEDSRIYGIDWYRFLGSARATLATESGSNVFDFDGSLKAISAAAEAAGVSFEAFHAEHVGDLDGIVRMNQVSPKVFEAIRLRTALVCFEGEYSGVIRPGEHYIPLKKDFSNVEEVFRALENIPYLEAMTERAYADVIGSGRYSYRAFMGGFDNIVDARVFRQPRAEFVSSPILRKRRGESAFQPVIRRDPYEQILNTGVLRSDLNRRDLAEAMAKVREAEVDPRRIHGKTPPADARMTRTYGPEDVVCYEYWSNAGATIEPVAGGTRVVTPVEAWHYAAGVNLDFSGIEFAEEHAWVRVVLRDAQGEFRTSLYDGDQDRLNEEHSVADSSEAIFWLKATAPAMALLLFRTGQFEASASATVVQADIFAASAYPAAILGAAKHLSGFAPGAFPWWD